MPILSFTMRSQDLDNPTTDTTQTARKTIKLREHYKMKYLKLLHIYHNINFTNIHDEEDVSQATNTILFSKISFLNGEQAIFYESDANDTRIHNGMICLGETVSEEHKTTFRDSYKVLHSKGLLFIREPFSIELFQLRTSDPSATNSNIATYEATGSHLIKPITADQFRGPLNSGGQFISFIFEYEEDATK
mgnify:CR=1 FL=1